MKIFFICGSLEPGRDGVGDYTRRLAGACVTRGHTVTVLALHDLHIERASDVAGDQLRLIRLPAAAPWPDRLADVNRHLSRLAPDWVSWQVVAQGLHPRGFLPAALLQQAQALRGPCCHVMLHELWLGLEAGAGWRARALGWLQRRGVLCLLEQLEPDCLHTSNPSYQEALRREGFGAGLLDLFGNVPVAGTVGPDESPWDHWLPVAPTTTDLLVAVTFGTLHRQWHPAQTVDWLRATARRLGRTPVLLALGRTGAPAAAILDVFRQSGVLVGVTGELPEASVSRLLAAADLGIAPHPWALIGKSGAAAAMLDHGLPVLVPRDDWHLRGTAPRPAADLDPLLARLSRLDNARTDRWLASRHVPQSALPRIADDFLEDLQCSPRHLSPA